MKRPTWIIDRVLVRGTWRKNRGGHVTTGQSLGTGPVNVGHWQKLKQKRKDAPPEPSG